MTLDRRSIGAQLAATELRRSVELDGGEAWTLDHHLLDDATLLP